MDQLVTTVIADQEQQLLDMFLTTEHLILFIGLFSIMLLLKWIKPISDFLFSEKWKWMIAPINLGFSTLGVFVLNYTTFTSTNMKIMMVLVASTAVTFTYEAMAKYIIDYITKKFQAKLT